MSSAEEVTGSNVRASLAAVSAKLAASPSPSPGTAEQAAQHPSRGKTSKNKPYRGKARTTKAAAVEKLLQRKAGATIEQIGKATGWQAHTCRAFLTGLRKKGREVIRDTDAGGKSVYRISLTVPSPPTDEKAN
ncbi:MAG: DUF3489 domain-containing protein [Pseudomonadota bacterium]